jgi:hypothetical protein
MKDFQELKLYCLDFLSCYFGFVKNILLWYRLHLHSFVGHNLEVSSPSPCSC